MVNNEFVIRTKRPGQYFSGEIKKHADAWFVVCISCLGGYRIDGPINVLGIKTKTNGKLISRLRSFAKKGRYIFSFSQSKF